jgi:hypothetical protein
MLRLLTDENFNQNIVRGLVRSNPDLDIFGVGDAGLRGAPDEQVLSWAAENNRIVLTHDRATMPHHAFRRAAAGLSMPGVFVISNRLAIGTAIDEILLVNECTEPSEWANLVVHLPL